jgi:hypothetical protein
MCSEFSVEMKHVIRRLVLSVDYQGQRQAAAAALTVRELGGLAVCCVSEHGQLLSGGVHVLVLELVGIHDLHRHVPYSIRALAHGQLSNKKNKEQGTSEFQKGI